MYNQALSRRSMLALTGAAGLSAVAGHAAAQPKSTGKAGEDTPAAPVSAGPGNGDRYYRFKIGNVEAAMLGDSAGVSPGSPYPLFGANASKEQVDAVLAEEFQPTDKGYSAVTVTALKIGGEVYLIDAGFGHVMGNKALAIQALRNWGVRPEQVTGVICSHLHADHVGGLMNADGSAAFPNAKYFVSKAEHDFWAGATPASIKSQLPDNFKTTFITIAQDAIKLMGKNMVLTEDKFKVNSALTLELSPGHTPGHQMVHIDGGSQQALMIADAVHNFALSLRKPEWHVQYDTDPVHGAKTRAAVLDRVAADRSLVLTYHMPFPSVGHVARLEKGGYQWRPSPWSW